MTFWQWLDNKWVRIGAISGSLVSAVIFAASSGMMEGLISPIGIKWVSLIGFLINVGVFGVGQRNSTQEKVADAKIEVASAMKAAILSTPADTR